VGREPTPAVAVVISFIDRINRGDVDALAELMSDDHTLAVLDEPPLVGKAANIAAWRGYMSSNPNYVIYPHQLAESDGRSRWSGTPWARTSVCLMSRSAR
jgi:hypothetical protein